LHIPAKLLQHLPMLTAEYEAISVQTVAV